MQKEISNGNGAKPELIINEGAKLSKPLQEAGFDVKTYSTSGGTTTIRTQSRDNTSVKPVQLPKPIAPKKKEPTKYIPVEYI